MAGQLPADTGERIGGKSVDSGSNTAAQSLAAAGPTPVANASEADGPFTKPDARFDCDTTRCAIRHPSGRIVVHTANAAVARTACGYAALIVIDDATAELFCPNPAVAIVTKRDLARHGSVAIHFAGPNSQPEIRYAVAEPYRPWHAQRQFSRAARGMPPYQRKPARTVKTPSDLPEDADRPAGELSQ
jgi:hypothetical protein